MTNREFWRARRRGDPSEGNAGFTVAKTHNRPLGPRSSNQPIQHQRALNTYYVYGRNGPGVGAIQSKLASDPARSLAHSIIDLISLMPQAKGEHASRHKSDDPPRQTLIPRRASGPGSVEKVNVVRYPERAPARAGGAAPARCDRGERRLGRDDRELGHLRGRRGHGRQHGAADPGCAALGLGRDLGADGRPEHHHRLRCGGRDGRRHDRRRGRHRAAFDHPRARLPDRQLPGRRDDLLLQQRRDAVRHRDLRPGRAGSRRARASSAARSTWSGRARPSRARPAPRPPSAPGTWAGSCSMSADR